MNTYKFSLFYLLITMFLIGCSSLPKNATQEEYNSVRDYVSMKIAGMTYSELYFRINQQSPPQYYSDGGVFNLPYYKEEPGNNFSEYNKYMMEISNKMNRLTSRYKRTGQMENFYSWAIGNYTE